MDGDQSNTHQQLIANEIPNDVYHHLFTVALLGYDADDVKAWYQTMLRQLCRINTNTHNSQAGYGGMTPASEYSIDARNAAFVDAGNASRRMTAPAIEPCMSSTIALPSTEENIASTEFMEPIPIYTNTSPDSGSQQYTPQSYSTYCSTPHHLDTTPEPLQTQLQTANWSPAPSSTAEPDMYTLSVSTAMSSNNPVAFAGESATHNTFNFPWFSAQDTSSMSTSTPQLSYPSSHGLRSQPQLSGPQGSFLAPDYNTQLSGASMPVIVPYATTSSASNSNYTKAAAIPTGPGASLYSSSNGFFPIIHVSSSRRRRKALQKGVKKMVQPLTGRRQQSV